jgi:hypothetical protein
VLESIGRGALDREVKPGDDSKVWGVSHSHSLTLKYSSISHAIFGVVSRHGAR